MSDIFCSENNKIKISFEIKDKYGLRKNMMFRSDQHFFLFWPDFKRSFWGLSDFLWVIHQKTIHTSKIFISNDSLFIHKNFDTKNVEIHRKINCLDIFLLKYPQKSVSIWGVFRVLRSLIMKNFKKNLYIIINSPNIINCKETSINLSFFSYFDNIIYKLYIFIYVLIDLPWKIILIKSIHH